MGVCFKCRRRKCFHPGVRRRSKAFKKVTISAKGNANQKVRGKAKGGSKAPQKETKKYSNTSVSPPPTTTTTTISNLPPELLEKILVLAMRKKEADREPGKGAFEENCVKMFFEFRTVNTIWRDICDNMARVADIEARRKKNYNDDFDAQMPQGLYLDQYLEYCATHHTFKLKNLWLQAILLLLVSKSYSNGTVLEYLCGGTQPRAPTVKECCHSSNSELN